MKRGLIGEQLIILDKPKDDKAKLKKLLDTSQTTTIKHIGKNNSIEMKLSAIEEQVNSVLGHNKENITVIETAECLHNYIDSAIRHGVIAIDTETVKGELGESALDTITCELTGVCLYTPDEKAAYIPVNHIDPYTQERLSTQISLEDLKIELLRLNEIKQIYHNAKYDLKVLHWYLGVDLKAYWDTQIAAQLINEIESHELKYLYAKYVEHKQSKEYDFSSLFKTVDFRVVPPYIASLYAATDALITYQLYKYQEEIFNTEDYKNIKNNIFFGIEIPVLPAIANMENNGISLDTEMANELSKKNHIILDEKYEKFVSAYQPYKDKIDQYITKYGEASKLKIPININSPIQLAILLYDIMELKSPIRNSPRGTGEEILEKFDNPVCKAVLEYRGVAKLLSTYIDKLPNEISKRTNRIHANFNQYGAKTGRLSSDKPNLQNIPHDDTRQLFYASDGCLLVGSDFSQQEPRSLARYSGDKNLQQAYIDGKDLYAWGASMIFKVPYEECLEFYPEGTKIVKDGKEIICGKKTEVNKEGKARRSKMKAILLGITYSKEASTIATDLKISVEEAQNLYNTFFREFPKVREFMIESQDMARKLGYVTTILGRRRRIPEMQLPPYEITLKNDNGAGFNPLFEDIKIRNLDTTKQDKYLQLLLGAKTFKEKNSIKERASNDGLEIIDNTYKLNEATRQCVNSRIQGTAADMTKLAMIKIYNNKELRDLGFKTLINVHDEIIGECPAENAEQCGKLLSGLMIQAADEIIQMPMKCDVEICKNWYGTSVNFPNDYARDYKLGKLRPIEYYNAEWRKENNYIEE